MSKKKKQFEALKNKLKNLYFNNLISIDKKNKKINFQIESLSEPVNLNYKSLDRPKIKNWVKPVKKPIILNKDNVNQITKNIIIEKKPVIINNIEKPTEYNKLLQNVLPTDNLKNIKLKTKKLNKNFNNYVKLNYKNIKPKTSYQLQTNLSNNKSDVEIINSENNKLPKNTTVINNTEKIITNTKNIVKKQNQYVKLFNLKNNIKIKYIEKPEDFKKIDLKNVGNTDTSIDIKKLYIPTKQELLAIKEKIVNKLTPVDTTVVKNKTFTIRGNVVNKSVNNFTTQVKYINNHSNIDNKNVKNNNYQSNLSNSNNIENKISKTDLIYTLPAFYEGTDKTPVPNDMIARVHKGETISNPKVQNLSANRENIVSQQKNLNLKLNNSNNSNNEKIESSDNTPNVDSENKDHYKMIPKDKNDGENRSKLDSATDEVANKILAAKNELNLDAILIKDSLKVSLFHKSLNNKTLPSWRTSYG